MKSYVIQPGMTWRKLGYGLYSDSLAYRRILEQNPKWNVMELPPLGAVLLSEVSPISSGLSQQTPIFGRNTGLSDIGYYPFENADEYYLSLSLYNKSCLSDVERLNGWSMDSSTVSGRNVG